MKKQLILLCALFTMIQIGATEKVNYFIPSGNDPVTIEGTVYDETKQPLIGANVLIKGTNIGTTTNFDGHFSFAQKQTLPVTLVLSYTGYETMELQVSSMKKPLKVYFQSSNVSLDEVVVSEYKATKKMKNQTMSMSVVTPGIAHGHMHRPESQPNHNTEDYDVINENRFFKVSNEPLSTFSIDVDAASYSNMRRFINNGQKPPKDAIRIEEMVNYFDYSYPQPQGDHPFEVVTEISECPWNKDHRLAHIGLQGKHIAQENLPATNLVFLIDVSGSMGQANKLPLLQSSFKLLVDQLREQDRVAIVVYAGAAGAVLPSTSGADKQTIKDAIMNLRAGGSTAGGAGIKLAYKIAQEHFVKGGNNRVILATDGDFNVGASSDGEMTRLIEQKRESGVFLTVMGFGMGNYKDNKMQKIADAGNGNHAYIDNIKEAKKVLVNEFGGTLFTIAKDVKLQIEFNPKKVSGYRLIGYENRVLANEDFNDDNKDAGELGAGHTVTAIYEIIPAGIKSEFLADVDDLKYQKNNKGNAKASKSGELMTIKLRYKKPDGNKSKLIEKAVMDTNLDLVKTSDNYRWSAAVASFGMLLRDSEFKKNATYDLTFEMAKGAKGDDNNGYRAECIEMMETMGQLTDMQVGLKD